jgi:hypothetical protein
MNYSTLGNSAGLMSQSGSVFWVSGQNDSNRCLLTFRTVDHPPLPSGPGDVASARLMLGLEIFTLLSQMAHGNPTQFDIRSFNQTGIRLFWRDVRDGNQMVRNYWFNDGSIQLNLSRSIVEDRLWNAWRLAFQECPGQRSRF